MPDDDDVPRGSALPWPPPREPAPGRWTLLASAALVVVIAVVAVVVLAMWM